MPALRSSKREAFCQEFMVDRNASAACLRAGYKTKNPNVMGYQLRNDPPIAERIEELEQDYLRRTKLDVDKVLLRYAQIATADPRELTAFRRHACRYCHGNDHEFQWRTEAEFTEALNAYQALPDKKKGMPPSNIGGYGFTKRLDPVITCPMCDGDGHLELVLPDTSQLSQNAAVLFAGIKETQHGVEIKMHNQMDALNAYARHLNLFEKDDEGALADGLSKLLVAISNAGSTAPIRQEGEEFEP